ncbi:gamma-glutamyltransferase, partial [Candidatus Neomarinimicrobiota bacterium]
MKRQMFLKSTMLGTAASMFGTTLSSQEPVENSVQRTDIPLDSDQLLARNRDRSTVVAQQGMSCTSQPLASMAAIDILRQGGNAIDAAICANGMLSVVEPMMCGPGGDLFAIVWIEKDRKLYGLNASGRSPYSWSLADAQALGIETIPVDGPLSWSVPGCVSGWQALLERFG